jgi:hypothetical protein
MKLDQKMEKSHFFLFNSAFKNNSSDNILR